MSNVEDRILEGVHDMTVEIIRLQKELTDSLKENIELRKRIDVYEKQRQSSVINPYTFVVGGEK